MAFGGCLNRVDRGKTGPLKVVGDKSFVPGPCSYAVEAEDQVGGATKPNRRSYHSTARQVLVQHDIIYMYVHRPIGLILASSMVTRGLLHICSIGAPNSHGNQ